MSVDLTKPDPLTQAQNSLEAYYKASPAIKRAMGPAVKNFVAFNKTRGTESSNVKAESDLPGVVLEPIGGTSNINFASNLSSLDWSWRVKLVTGDMRLNAQINPLLFAVFAATVHAVDSSLDGQLVGLLWNDYPFAKNLTFAAIQEGPVDPQTNGSINGWMAICDLTMHMLFPSTLLREFNGA
jgi:hypothetical protein